MSRITPCSSREDLLSDGSYDEFYSFASNGDEITLTITLADEPNTNEHFAYDGSHFDRITGLGYHPIRHFDPTPGQWLAEDPFGHDANDANLHPYAGQPANETERDSRIA